MKKDEKEGSVQPEWMRALPFQMQSVLFLASRGPDGIAKKHPCKAIVIAYRGTVFKAAKYGRSLHWGERADTFMSLDVIAQDTTWQEAIKDFFHHADALPRHYLLHLTHGAEILGYKHPDPKMRTRWLEFYRRSVEDMHLNVETEEQMDKRLGDWDRKFWDEV